MGDTRDKESLRQAVRDQDVVFHLAGAINAPDWKTYHEINAAGTFNLVEACLEENPGLGRFVHVSSISAAGPSPRGTALREEDECRPVSDYGRSKRAAELAAEVWCDRVPTTVIRPGIVFGPWDRLLLPMFRSIDRLGIHPIPTFAPPPLSLLHVQDLVEVLVRAAERGTRLVQQSRGASPGAGYYFACSGQHLTYPELGRMVAQALGRRHVLLLHLVEPLPWLVAGVTELFARLSRQPVIVNVDKMRESIQPSWAASPQAIRQQLGFSEACSLDQRLRQTVDWYREHRWV